MSNIVEKQLSYDITGLCFKVHKELGRFCREIQYANKLEELLKNNLWDYEREYQIKKLVQDSPNGNRVDFIIKFKVLVDIKAKNFITKEDYFQMQRYLQASGLEIGLIVNFRDSHLKPKRVLNTRLYSDNSDIIR
jgi:GxxExxY protein